MKYAIQIVESRPIFKIIKKKGFKRVFYINTEIIDSKTKEVIETSN
jgi:hypothetical protein